MTVSGEAPRLAVIIPHYNDVVRLRRCLEALVPQLRAHPGVETVVADNGTPGGLDALADAFPSVQWLHEPEKGAAAARNCGVRHSSAAFLAFLDADCVPDADWLDTALRRTGEDVVIGGAVGTFDETPPPRSGAEAFEMVFAFHQRVYIERKGFSVTANMLTSRAVFEAVGPMRVGLAEDVDWCRRATGAGFALRYDGTLRVTHPTRSDWAALRRKWRRTTDEMYGLHREGGGGRLSWALRAVAVAGSALWHAAAVLRHPGLSPRERIAGIGTLLRLRATRAAWMLAQAAGGAWL